MNLTLGAADPKSLVCTNNRTLRGLRFGNGIAPCGPLSSTLGDTRRPAGYTMDEAYWGARWGGL